MSEIRIADLTIGMDVPELEASVVLLQGQLPKLAKNGQTRYQHVTLDDGTGQIRFTLFDDLVGQVREGTRIRLTNGYVTEYPQGSGKKKLQLRKEHGTFEILSQPAAAPASPQAVPSMSYGEEESRRITRLACLKAAVELSTVATVDEAVAAAERMFQWAWDGHEAPEESPEEPEEQQPPQERPAPTVATADVYWALAAKAFKVVGPERIREIANRVNGQGWAQAIAQLQAEMQK